MGKNPKDEELEKKVKELEKKVNKYRQTEEVLLQKEEKYRTILDNVEVAYYELDLEGNITDGTDSGARAFGGSLDEFVGHNFAEFCDEENAKALFETYQKVYLTGEPAKEVEWNITAPDGTKIFAETSAALMRDANGEPTGFCGILQNVTERKKAEEALRQNEEKYRGILENMEDGYCEVDLDGNFTYANSAAASQVGTTREKLVGTNFSEYLTETDAKRIFEAFNRMVKNGKPISQLGWSVVTPDGIEKHMEITASLIRDSQGNTIAVSYTHLRAHET